MKKTIYIAEEVVDNTPKEFLNLPDDATYKLTKTMSKYEGGFVGPGDTITGDLQIVNVASLGLPGVKISGHRGFTDYIRTSPIVKVLDATETQITFETEGGVYMLEKLSNGT
jgi:hypothetical protein